MPTPRSSDGPKGGPGQTGDGLQPAVSLLPMPTVAMSESRSEASMEQRIHATGHNYASSDLLVVLERERRSSARGESHAETQSLLPTPKATNNENRQTAGQYGPNLGEAIRSENGARWGDYAPAIAQWEAVLGRRAPDPTDVKGRLSPAFVCWLMGWPDGWLDGLGLSRSQKLRILGNGVVVSQAVAAYSALLERALKEAAA